jgi:hypothetical protein
VQLNPPPGKQLKISKKMLAMAIPCWAAVRELKVIKHGWLFNTFNGTDPHFWLGTSPLKWPNLEITDITRVFSCASPTQYKFPPFVGITICSETCRNAAAVRFFRSAWGIGTMKIPECAIKNPPRHNAWRAHFLPPFRRDHYQLIPR